MVFCWSWEKAKYVNFIRAFGGIKNTQLSSWRSHPFFFWIGVIWLKKHIPPWFFRKFHPHFSLPKTIVVFHRRCFLPQRNPQPFFPPTSNIFHPGDGWSIFWGGGLFWGQPWIWILASHKSSRSGHLASWMFVPAGLATCFNGATRRYLELCALPKHLRRKKERLRTTSTTL